MSDRWHHHAYTRPAPQPRQSDAERWQAWCASIVDTIEQIRADAAPVRCPTCDCTAHPPAETRRCYVCGEVKAITAFARSHSRRQSRHYACRSCRNKASAKRHQQKKIRMFRAAVSGVAV